MSTTMAAASMEPAASTVEAPAVKATSAVISASAVVPAAYEAMATSSVTASGIIAATGVAVRVSFMSVAPAPTGVPMAPTIVTPTATIITAIPEPARMSPVVPRARADKHAVYEIVWTVVAVRRAGIRIIVIVPVGADWRTSRIGGTDSDPETYLRLRIR